MLLLLYLTLFNSRLYRLSFLFSSRNSAVFGFTYIFKIHFKFIINCIKSELKFVFFFFLYLDGQLIQHHLLRIREKEKHLFFFFLTLNCVCTLWGKKKVVHKLVWFSVWIPYSGKLIYLSIFRPIAQHFDESKF